MANSWNKVGSALAKATFRPADGHEIKIGGTFQDFLYDFGQPNRGAGTANQGTSVYATDVQNTTTTARWKYGRPDDMLLKESKGLIAIFSKSVRTAESRQSERS